MSKITLTRVGAPTKKIPQIRKLGNRNTEHKVNVVRNDNPSVPEVKKKAASERNPFDSDTGTRKGDIVSTTTQAKKYYRTDKKGNLLKRHSRCGCGS